MLHHCGEKTLRWTNTVRRMSTVRPMSTVRNDAKWANQCLTRHSPDHVSCHAEAAPSFAGVPGVETLIPAVITARWPGF
jgi:hypothetical protein